MSDAPLLTANGLARVYGDFSLQVPELTVKRSETLCIVGPTGAGKSTLLRMLCGLESPDAGSVSFDGLALHRERLPIRQQRRIAMVFQRPLLLSRTAAGNILYALELRGRSSSNATKVARLVQQLGLEAILKQSAATLSGGQTQLVALARALVIEPDLLLLDEPTSNLDPARVQLVEEAVNGFQRASGATVIWSTHNLFQARRVASRVGLLIGGRLIEVAGTEEFFERPADGRVADFVNGRMVY